MSELRDSTAAELTEYLREISLDSPWSDEAGTSTRMKYTSGDDLYPSDRLAYHQQLIAAALQAQGTVSASDSLGIVVTAGAPGAGKSTALRQQSDYDAFRNIDADDFKDALLRDARATGELDTRLAHSLGDGKPVSLRELSAYVHAESTEIANTMRNQCLAAGENVVIHGTLASLDYTNDILRELDQYGYQTLTIFNVERPAADAVDQALERWWRDRCADRDGIGGRFVAPQIIESHYVNGGVESRCAGNAVLLRDQAEQLDWTVTLIKA